MKLISALGALLAVSFTPLALAQLGTLRIDDGVVVKFGPDAGLVVGGTLSTGTDVVFTSIADDSVGGSALGSPGVPAPGDWAGIRINERAANPFAGATIRYAEVGLDLVHNYVPQFLQLTHNEIGIRLVGPASPVFYEYSMRNNGVGLLSENATPQFQNSELIDNSGFAIDNRSFALGLVINARNNWWGDASGPQDPFDNPTGLGNPVSRGVDYGARLFSAPLIDCALVPVENQVRVPEAVFNLRCRGALEARLSESPNFAGVSFTPMSVQRTFALSPGEGSKTVYAQFRGPAGQVRQTSANVSFQIQGPQVSITSPPQSLSLTSATAVQIAATVSDSLPITQVQFYAGNILLNTDFDAPYSTTWNTQGVGPGDYRIRAVAVNSSGQSGNNGSFGPIIYIRETGNNDTQPPTISNLSFAGVPLVDAMNLTGPGLLTAQISDDTGVTGVQLTINDVPQSSGGLAGDGSYQKLLTFPNAPNGPLVLRLQANDQAGNQISVLRFVTLDQLPPAAPVFSFPENGVTVTRGDVQLRGTATLGSTIQLYLDGQPVASPRNVADNGQFVFALDLPAEGAFEFTADASNAAGTGPLSTPLSLTWTIPPPSLLISSPNADALITRDTRLSASVVYARPGSEVEFYVNGDLIGTDASAPYSVDYLLANTTDGDKTLQVILRNGSTTSQQARNFRVLRAAPPPQPFTPPYVGSGLSATPAVSYGLTPVLISGRLRQTDSVDLVPNAAATLILRTNQFDRRINVVTDAQGEFEFSFIPRNADQGVYQVMAMHPDARPFTDPTPTGIANFTINRLTPAKARTYVAAPRGFAQEVRITVSAGAGTGATGVRLVARADDQPSGTLPVGITLSETDPVDIPAGQSHTFSTMLQSTEQSPVSGPLVVAVVAQDSGSLRRATTRLDYELFPAAPALIATPISIYTGVRRGQAISERFELKNRGLVAANNISLSFVPGPGGAATPSWISLVSPAQYAVLEPGETRLIELGFAPGSGVVDGLYEARLQVAAFNAPGGPINITAAVNEQGSGQVRFKTVNMFTGTLNEDDEVIPGLQGARMVLTHETNPNLRAEGLTDAQGEVTLAPLPPGRYLWRASASRHEPASGRVLIRPGIIVDERVFLDFATVSFTWSVTPTTIVDNYNVIISATFQTQVPAPVITMQPAAINLPDMQIGEVISGEFTITNRGLLRADEVSLQLDASDPYYRIEVLGSVPNELAAGQVVVLPYKITALQSLPGANRNVGSSELDDWLHGRVAGRANAAPRGSSGCGHYVYRLRLPYQYQCAAGDVRPASAGSSVHKVYGGGCASGPTNYFGGPGGGNGGGWAGGSGSAGGGPPQGPECGPDCTEGCACSNGCGPPAPPPAPPPIDGGPPPPPQSCPSGGASGGGGAPPGGLGPGTLGGQ